MFEKKQVYIINGAAGVGKDTFVEIAKHHFFIKTGLPTYNISSVDNVKAAAKILGWDGQKDEKGRKFLSDLKDLSSWNYEGPYKYMSDEVESKDKGFFFLHIREPMERLLSTAINKDQLALYGENDEEDIN